MVHILAGITLALYFGAIAVADAQPQDFRKLKETTKPARPDDKSGRVKACPEYGAGFYRLAGSDTCIRIGGAVDFGAGASGSRR